MTKQKPGRAGPRYSLGEEIANSVTHGVGALLSVSGTVLLILRAVAVGHGVHIVSVSIYGLTLFLLHLSSTLYHAIQAPRAKLVFRIFDHCSIFLLIAGTYTPFLLIALGGAWGIGLLITIWALAIAGIVFKSIFIHRLEKVSVGVYVAMGCLIVIAAREVWLRIPHEALGGMAIGGLFYILGISFYSWKRLPYNHAIWHLFVLGGSISHYFAILIYLMPAST